MSVPLKFQFCPIQAQESRLKPDFGPPILQTLSRNSFLQSQIFIILHLAYVLI